MTKYERLKLTWNGFSEESTFETIQEWRAACKSATKEDLINLASNLAGYVAEMRERHGLSVARKTGPNVTANSTENGVVREGVRSC